MCSRGFLVTELSYQCRLAPEYSAGYPVEHELDLPAKKVDERGRPPRYFTWTTSMPAIILNSSPMTWSELPLPAEAKLSLRGVKFSPP
jgi:hypothetical protein